MKRWTTLSICAALVLAVCIASVGLYLLSRIPPIETQIPPGSTPVHVRLSAPESPSGWPLNAYIPVQAEAYGGGTISMVELYINGQLYEQVKSSPGWNQPEYAAVWNWQPGTLGSFILVAKATSASGGTGLSDPLLLQVKNEAGTVSPVLVKEGDTLQSIAESSHVSLEELAQANPSFAGPAQPIPVDTPIDVPNPPDPVTNPKIIPALPLPQAQDPVQTGQNPPPAPEDGKGSEPSVSPEVALPKFRLPSLQDLQFWISQNAPGKKTSLPLEPVIKATFQGCDVTLRLANIPIFNDSSDPAVDTSTNESGFFIYRSQDGEAFERLATLPVVTSMFSWEYADGYILKDQYGAVTYTLSAFNSAGETMSAPVTLPLDQANCVKPGRMSGFQSKIKLENGELSLPFSMDVAYLYLSINDNRAYRVPEGDRMFLPNSGVKLNLDDYFNTLLQSFTAGDFDISMEVWGWNGGKLIFAGTYQTTIHRAVLLVCSQEGEGKCSGKGDGQWLPEISLSDQKPVKDQVYEFKWIGSNISKVKDVCYQFAAGPYPNDDFWNMNLPISSGCMEYIHGNEGTFTMYMGSLLYPTKPPEFLGWGAGSQLFDYNSNWFQYDNPEGSAFTLYARAIPRLEMSGFTRFSNPVILHRSTSPAPSNLPPLASPNPSLYDVEILRDTYIPPTFETEENWGCVVIDEDPSHPENVGKTICPPMITAHDDCAGKSEALCLLGGMGDSLLFLVDQFVYAIKTIKWEMTEAITYTIPYCHDYGPCYKAIQEVVEQVVSYGIGYPAHADTSEDLMAGWIGSSMLSTASEYTNEIGIDADTLKKACGTDCQKKIGLQVIQSIRQKKSMESQKACIGAYEAYFHNREAMCLDPSIIVHPAEGSGYFPAGITVKITRKELPPGQSPPETIKDYRIGIVVTGSNDTTVYGPGYTAQLYSPVSLPAYNLAPGDSMVLNTQLIPCSTYGSGSCVGADGWKGMKNVYFNGTTRMEATELCYSPGSSLEWVPCTGGGSDRWQFDNPKTAPTGQP